MCKNIEETFFRPKKPALLASQQSSVKKEGWENKHGGEGSYRVLNN